MIKSAANNYAVGTIIFQSLHDSEGFSRSVSISGTQILSPRVFKNINHVGLCIGDNQVIEATRQYGVIKRSLNDFLSMADYSIAATVSDTELIESAITFADSCLDKPYNHSFYPDDDGLYCNQFIMKAFKYRNGDDYFQQYPMIFSI